MRKKFALFQASPRRLLSLVLMQTFVVLAVPFVDSNPGNLFNIANLEQITGGPPLIKIYQLLSACNKKYVQMTLSNINSRGRVGDTFTHLKFESDTSGSGKIWIKSARLGDKFLCFSRRGRLIAMQNRNRRRCMFTEETDRHYIKLRSAASSKWYVGFNRKGKKMKGYAKTDTWWKKQCFSFTKTEYNPDRLHAEKFADLGNSLELDYQGNNR